MSVDWIGYGYAAVIASGGVVGYAKARKCFLLYEVKIYTYIKSIIQDELRI